MKTKKIPKQVRITTDQERFLKQRSRELGLSESEIIRRALDAAEHRSTMSAEELRQNSRSQGVQSESEDASST